MTQILTEFRTWLRYHRRLKTRILPTYLQILHWRWQLRNLLTGHRPITLSASNHALKLYPDGSIPEVLYTGNFEAIERDFVAAVLSPGMIVIDAGANVGLYTVIASALVGKEGKVYAFEPGQLTFERLQRNLRLNDCKNVVANCVALADTDSPMVLRIDPAHPALDGHRYVVPMEDAVHATNTDEVVNCQTLDDYLLQRGITQVDFIKIDVEGAELALLRGATNTLQNSANLTVLLECSQNRETVKELLDEHSFDYFLWDHIEKALKPTAFDEAVVIGSVILRRKTYEPQ